MVKWGYYTCEHIQHKLFLGKSQENDKTISFKLQKTIETLPYHIFLSGIILNKQIKHCAFKCILSTLSTACNLACANIEDIQPEGLSVNSVQCNPSKCLNCSSDKNG